MGSEARHIGLQTQAILGYQFNRNFLLVGVANWMSPGDFISETQEKQPNDLWLLSLALQWTFLTPPLQTKDQCQQSGQTKTHRDHDPECRLDGAEKGCFHINVQGFRMNPGGAFSHG
jgi:hypothetical protein